jgi:CRP/FNR family transcriptional regulator, cyclic AMP receptor protein
MVSFKALARDGADIVLEPGAVLFTQGEPGDAMYGVLEGAIELVIGGDVVEVVHEGGFLGELALIDSAPRSATARAVGATRVVSVDEKRFTYLVHEHPTFALQVMRAIAGRLRNANHAAHDSAGEPASFS